MKARPLAVLVCSSLTPWLEETGMDTAVLDPPAGIQDVGALLEERGLRPDVLVQEERLAPRTLLRGLESLPCPVVFWAKDPHLNHYWQAPYCSLFDEVACTQKAWLKPLRDAGAPAAHWLTWSAPVAPWTAHAARPHPMAFVGRVNRFRPMRERFTRFLAQRFPLRLETGLPPGEVQGVYLQSRIAPGESIGGEITHRLFLTAQAGCAVIEPRHANGLEELFEPGVEIETYGDGLELAHVARRFLDHPDEAGRLGRAAWERARREHKPCDRARRLGGIALSAARGPRQDADRLFWLAAARCLESGLLPAAPEDVIKGLAAHQEDPDCLAAILSILTLGGQDRDALTLGLRFAAQGFAPAHAGFNACLGGLSLKLGEHGLAARLQEAFAAAAGEPKAQGADPGALHAAWAETLTRRGVLWRPGFPFDPERHLPAAACEFHILSLKARPAHQPTLRKAEALLRGLPGSELYRLGYLSELSLRSREDHRLGLALGRLDIAAFRVEEGLEELRLALDAARAKGAQQSFLRALAAQDPRGLIRQALNVKE